SIVLPEDTSQHLMPTISAHTKEYRRRTASLPSSGVEQHHHVEAKQRLRYPTYLKVPNEWIRNSNDRNCSTIYSVTCSPGTFVLGAKVYPIDRDLSELILHIAQSFGRASGSFSSGVPPVTTLPRAGSQSSAVARRYGEWSSPQQQQQQQH